MKRTTEQVLREEIEGTQAVVQAALLSKDQATAGVLEAMKVRDAAEDRFRLAVTVRNRAVAALDAFLGHSSSVENELEPTPAQPERVYVGGDPLPSETVVGLAQIEAAREAIEIEEFGRPPETLVVEREEHVHSAEQLAELATLPAPEGVLVVTNAGDVAPEEGTAEVEIVRGGSRVEKGRRR